MLLEGERKRLAETDTRRSLELAAYFSCCNLLIESLLCSLIIYHSSLGFVFHVGWIGALKLGTWFETVHLRYSAVSVISPPHVSYTRRS
ncbi:hypothetical protein BBBOND_0102240 [Babesia bigemina]|uniref:Uncharacterized protein n=1 Tax=Babesia bigemina TaxID=5866 RepID=A0A061D846_BABBI|nr:hypothetical protein BBBOND_0102240 [Babesia bigemina]CDR93895.1 hypothetical protein BBBOND_0102240 [Babesia bigemina]|eukprot:XP_012766081.1 hypothetical protein BBBOND_0102240 [Babesia bigemina]